MQEIQDFLNFSIPLSKEGEISIKSILFVVLVLFLTALLLRLVKKIVTRKLPDQDKLKFNSVFSFSRYFVFLIVLLISLDNNGVDVTAVFAASTALLVGVGLALQTFFQDIISGIFILIDQSVHVGDIIELDGKVGRVDEIKLRTTRAVTIDNKVLIIPNHKYLTSSLYNWTENGIKTRESVSVGVAYGSDVAQVTNLLTKAAQSHPKVLQEPPVLVVFEDFGESALQFKVIFTLDNSFEALIPKSEIRYRIDKLFRENNISIPFPQRDVHLKTDLKA
ncbi:MAG: mechanosensitive ion channel [Flavobacteriaceae bacterium]|nr:mechanosensitive ion channel [Flavobacteriaceae bacterium]